MEKKIDTNKLSKTAEKFLGVDKKPQEKKTVKSQSELVERLDPKLVTEDGRQLLL